MSSTRKPAAGWLRGTTIKKGGNGSAGNTRSNTPQVQSTSSTIYGGGVKDPSGRTSEYSSMEDQCPVCKSDRYLNPKLRLLVSSCYHKMCESCIDRLFTLGPAPCPICQKVLRKLAFTPQTFEDLGVEKEVAIRRRLAKEFNKRREDFPSLREYNDYLQDAEDIAFNLINNIDVAATEQRIAEYRARNAALIALNVQREEADAQALKEQEEYERKEREYRAAELRREEEEGKAERERDRREIIDELEAGSKDARKLIAKYNKRKTARQDQQEQQLGGYGDYARLLKSRAMSAQKATVKDEPHVPMQDDWYAYDDLYQLRPGGYEDPFSDAVRRDREGIMRGGGYIVEEAWDRALRSAVAGLDLAPLSGLPDKDAGGDVVMSAA